ncbi:MAG: hypothetical protein GY846_15620 [Deltaproteobacteria bacterium]|nr:hypothetical protein [Deltaproteobacteria bacterium]
MRKPNALWIFMGIMVFASTVLTDSAIGQIQEEVFLRNTDHELHVYRIFGEAPGKTIMLIGGIQGDEPGGYLTADLYAAVHLKKGNLIVVPRANFYSILLNQRQGLTGDMNRKFASNKYGKRTTSLEDEIVFILKQLIAESDCLLNLHEGSGYYSPTWINDNENPMRFGQSIIYDADVFEIPGENRNIHLGELASKVIAKANSQIDERRYHFQVNNHDTLSEGSKHKEQRKSATYYALTQAHIPAFGLETSKSIKDLKTKIRLHKIVVNAMMAEFGIVQDPPRVTIAPPRLNYLLVKINGKHPYAMRPGSRLEIEPGDEVVIVDIIANYQRGLVADLQGLGTSNDTNMPFRLSKPTRVIVRKDAQKCGWVDLVPRIHSDAVKRFPKAILPEALRAKKLLIDVDGEMKIVVEGQVLKVPKGSRITLKGVETTIPALDNNVIVNLKGFVPPKATNDGQDLHYPVYTDQNLLRRYSKNGQGKHYPVIIRYKNKQIGKFWMALTPNKIAG